MKFFLRTNVGETGFVEISENYFNDLSESFCCLLNAYHVEEKFDLVVGNFIEFEKDVYGALLNHMVGRYPGWANHHEVQLTINRRLSNFLSACRTYFDQIYRHLILCCKRDRSVAKALKKYASALYEAEIDYRIMEALRNHVQHHSLAVHRSKIGGKRVGEEGEARVEYGIGFAVDKKELSKNTKFKAQVLNEMEEHVDIVSTVRGYLKNINLVQLRARALIEARIEHSNLTLLDAAGGSRDSDGYFLPVAIRTREDSKPEETVPLDLSHYEEIMKLRMKNPARSKFDTGYFTGTPLA